MWTPLIIKIPNVFSQSRLILCCFTASEQSKGWITTGTTVAVAVAVAGVAAVVAVAIGVHVWKR